MIKSFLLISMGLAGSIASIASAANGYDGSKQSTAAHARPLIEAFLAEKSGEYQVDLTPDPTGFHVRRSAAELFYWPAWPLVGGTRFDYSCRPIDATIPALQRIARFYLRTTYDADAGSISGRYGEPHFSLVRGCSLGNLSQPPLLKLWPRNKRLFEDQEAVELAQAMVQRLAADATDFQHETPSREMPWDVPDLVDSAYDEPVEDCRSISFVRGNSLTRQTVGLLIRYDEEKLSSRIPAEYQEIYKDPHSLRPFRLTLTRGCFGMDLMRPGTPG